MERLTPSLDTIGTIVSFAFESSSGVRPTTGYVKIPKVKSHPSMDTTPNTEDDTSYDNLNYTTKKQMLIDLDVFELSAGLTQELFDLYNDASNGIIAKFNAAKALNKGMWLCVKIVGCNKAWFCPVEPDLVFGLPAGDTASLYEKALHFTPVGEPIWDYEPSYASDSLCVVTISGVAADDVVTVISNGVVKAQKVAVSTTLVIELPYGSYSFVATNASSAKSAIATLDSATASVALA